MRLARVLGATGLAVFLSAFDGSVLYLALPGIAAEFHARIPDLAWLGSVVSLGALGALPLAVLADRSGRRRLLAVAVLGFAAADLASGFAPHLAAFASLRVVAAAFEGVAGTVAGVLVVEHAAPEHRAIALAGLALAGGLGAGASTILYPVVAPHWRVVYQAGGAGLAAAPLIWALVPESGAWAAARRAAHVPALRLVTQTPWRRRLAVTAVSGVMGTLLYSPAGLFTAVYAGRNLGMSPGLISTVVIASGVAAAAGYVAAGWLSDRAGRRWLGTLLAAATAAAAAASFGDGRAGFWAGQVGGSVLGGGTGPVLGAWFAEIFPTRARVTAQSLNGVAGTLGGIAGLQVVGLTAARMGLGPAIGVMVVPAVAGAFLLLLLPETRGRPLPD